MIYSALAILVFGQAQRESGAYRAMVIFASGALAINSLLLTIVATVEMMK